MKEKAKLIQPAKSALAKLGADLKRAHRRRRLSMALLGFAPFLRDLADRLHDPTAEYTDEP